MPTYLYHCNCCGEDFEAKQNMDHQPDAQCPQCGGWIGEEVRRVPQAPAIILKTYGFYKSRNKEPGP